MSGSDTGTIVLVRATLRTTFRLRLELRLPRLFVDLRFVAAKVVADYAILRRQKQDRTANKGFITGQAHRVPPWASEALALQRERDQARPM